MRGQTLLNEFYEKNNRQKPDRLIMFWDGVSEGQFLTVLPKKLLALREACMEMEEGYQPGITYLVGKVLALGEVLAWD